MTERVEMEPVRKTIIVNRPVEEAFRAFTDSIGSWWPLQKHAVAAGREDGVKAKTAVVEGRAGGRVYEVMSDGTEGSWGEVLVWEPPGRLLLAWKPNTNPHPPTEVEVRFTPEGNGTRVDLEHRGWERLGDLGPEARQDYDSGWPGVLERFRDFANGEGVA